MTNKEDLTDKDYKELVKEFEKGNFPGKLAVRLYKHPIKSRQILKSNGQRKAIRGNNG